MAIIQSLGDFVPEVIIAYTPAGFLQKAFPDAVLLHRECAYPSLPPFAVTWFLDPVGIFGLSFLKAQHEEVLGAMKYGEEERTLLRGFRSLCRRALRDQSPYLTSLEEFSAKFSKTLLLPLQFSSFYLFDSLCSFRSQGEYLIDVLNALPSDIGLVVTRHPLGEKFSSDFLEYLSANYSNLLITDEIEGVCSVSDYIAPLVDGVITLGSKVGFMAMLWNKHLIALSDDFLAEFADGRDLHDVHALLEKPVRNRDRLLYWMLTHYSVPRPYANSESWLFGLAARVQLWNRGECAASDVYQMFADPIETFESYANALEAAPMYRTSLEHENAELQLRVQDLEKQLSHKDEELLTKSKQMLSVAEELARCTNQVHFIAEQHASVVADRNALIEAASRMQSSRSWRLFLAYAQARSRLLSLFSRFKRLALSRFTRRARPMS
jgi:hypothetical protein